MSGRNAAIAVGPETLGRTFAETEWLAPGVRSVAICWLVVFGVTACRGAPGFEAAGVFAYTLRDARPVALLGEEWRARCGGWCWSDFVGGRKRANGRWETVIETAAREFHQETRHSYDRDAIEAQLAALEPIPVESGRVMIFVLQVEDRDADALARLPDVIDDEKERYCWLELEHLLAAADAGAGDEVELLRPCGGRSERFFAPALANLRSDGALRPSLDALLLD